MVQDVLIEFLLEFENERKINCLRLYGLTKAYDELNRETLWQILMLYGVGGRLLNEIKSI